MKQMNLIALMNYAWDQRKYVNYEQYATQSTNLISHAYVEIRSKAISYGHDEDKVFYALQDVYAFIINCDGDVLQGEYDAYVNFCRYAGIKALSVSDIKSLYARKTVNDLSASISYINSFRSYVDDSKFEALVLSFCYLALLGDKTMDENEYYILRCFFDKDYDYCPSDWATFKREW